MPEATAVQERPIAEDYQELKRIGEDVDSQITYTSEAARNAAKAHGVELPGTKGELYKALGEKAEELVADNERKKEERKEKVPDIILSEENEEGWERLGWTKRDREIVKDKLREKLFPHGTPVDEGRLENILHMLIASGKTPQDVLPVINDASN